MLKVLAFICSLAAFAADAPPPREIDFTQVLVGPTGDPLPAQTMDGRIIFDKDGKTTPVTLGDAAAIALECFACNPAAADADRNVNPTVKYDRDQLARKIYKNAHATLSVDELKTIKDRIGLVYGPGQVGAAWPLLDPTILNK
jgi:hypothetical protein